MIYLALLSLLAPPAAIGETSGAEGQLYVQGGLTAEETARRAEATSFEVEARRADLEAAAAAVDQALLGYVPRLSGTARYVRLSSIETPIAGNIVAAP
jgi:outer membrane protein TolC